MSWKMMIHNTQENLITTGEAASILDCNRSWIPQLVKAKRLHPVILRHGKRHHRMFRRQDVLDYQQARIELAEKRLADLRSRSSSPSTASRDPSTHA
jgi:hypothetical protein